MIDWPEKYRPDRTAVHVHNEMGMPAPAETVWAWLVRADLWPSWYPNSQNVEVEHGAEGLQLGSRFRWKTFGVNLKSKVEEFVPYERLGWTSRAMGIDSYHAWLIERRPAGCHVITEENQNGWLARLSHAMRPSNTSRYHQIWLQKLLEKAKSGLPPSSTS
jgi:uncharacterized protein YndB with AHSA1/START domain